MIANDHELHVTLERIARFQAQKVAHSARQKRIGPTTMRRSVQVSLAEIDRMQLEVREYLNTHPTELETS